MKILLLLSNHRKQIAFWLTICGLAVIAFVYTLSTHHRVETIYHQSHWNQYAPEVDRALLLATNNENVNLSHIFGGVVSHHIPTTIPKLVSFYMNLKKTQQVKNIIIIGPDHTDAGFAPVTISNASFYTVFGEVRPIEGLAEALENEQVAHIEEEPFDKEHSIGSQMLVISKIFPGVQVTPIILRSDTTQKQANQLGEVLSKYLGEDTVLIASVDFSHYLSTTQATPLDAVSGGVIKNLDSGSLALVKADSSKTMVVFMKAMINKKASETSNFEILNTNNLMQNADYTTGYVFGFWGRK